MIYITGDIHGDPTRFSKNAFPEQENMTKNDYVIILGDFGLIWDDKENKNEKYWLKWLDEKPFTTLFIDGNHENFNKLYSYPVEDWKGGKIHKISDSVYHLMRGQIFNIDNTTFFTFGGARSHDIQAGILDRNDPDFKLKKKELDKDPWNSYRILNETWWELELPTNEEIELGRKTLSKVNHVNYILTHCPPNSVFKKLDFTEKENALTIFLDEVERDIDYDVWFFGHLHDNRKINNKMIMLYEQIVKLPELVKEKDVKTYEEDNER